MIKLYHSLGPEKFPLNEQTFYPNHMQMVSAFQVLFPHVSFKTQKKEKKKSPKNLFGQFFIKSLL